MENIPDMVVLAGPNGVGKSSILEAIVYFKELFGSYGSWHKPTGVVNINADHAEIKITFQTTELEREYLTKIGNKETYELIEGSVKIRKNDQTYDQKSEAGLHNLLSAYKVDGFPELGLFDFFNPNRFINRKDLTQISVGGLSLSEEKRRRMTLSPQQKFDMTKDYLAQQAMADIQEIEKMLEETGVIRIDEKPDSLKLLKDIFSKLLAPKRFKRVNFRKSPIVFEVETPDGIIDIDNLSSGEKEIFYCFTELIKLNPNNSIVLFDEPDLHLNYEVENKIVETLRNIGSNNQFWLTTHSFGIMNSVKFNELFRVENYNGKNQIKNIFDSEDKREVVSSITGDVGFITLAEKIVFVEGVEYTDKRIFNTFFPEKKGKIAFISSQGSSNLLGVSKKTLDLLNSTPKFDFYYSIRDRDFLSDDVRTKTIKEGNGRFYVLKKYHIENYLIDFDAIFNVLNRGFPNKFESPQEIKRLFTETIKDNYECYLSKLVKNDINKIFNKKYISIGFPNVEEKSLEQIALFKEKVIPDLEEENIREIVRTNREKITELIDSGEWINILPGKEIIKQFCNKHTKGLHHNVFKNQIMSEIKDNNTIDSELVEIVHKISEGQRFDD